MKQSITVEQTSTNLLGTSGQGLRPRPHPMTRLRRLMALLAPVIAPYDPSAQAARRLLPPSAEHLMGTDELGRDVFSRVVHGARTSLYVGLLSVTLRMVLRRLHQ